MYCIIFWIKYTQSFLPEKLTISRNTCLTVGGWLITDCEIKRSMVTVLIWTGRPRPPRFRFWVRYRTRTVLVSSMDNIRLYLYSSSAIQTKRVEFSSNLSYLLPVWYTGTRVVSLKVRDKYGGLWLSLRDSTARQATEVSIFYPKPLYISSIPQGGPPQKGRKKQDFFSGIRNLYDLHRINSKMTKTISFVFNFLKDQNTFNILLRPKYV